VYDKAEKAIERITSIGSDAAEVAKVIGDVLHAGHPRFRYRVGTGSHVMPALWQAVPTSVRDRVTRKLGGV
jgi:hypothetical protein